MQNRIKELLQVDWRKMEPLQPDNAKLIGNYADLEASILKYGFSVPFYVWEHKGLIYCADGHTRKEVLSNMEGVPDLLPAVSIIAKNRKEAIKILLEVYNQKHNPFDKEVALQMLEAEQIELEEINLESIYMVKPKGFEEDDEELPEEQTFIPTFKLEIICTTEKEQHKTFNKLSEEGYEIRFPD